MSSIKHKIKLAGYKCILSSNKVWLCPVKKKKMLCRSLLRLSYSDNPRAISEKMHEIDPEWEIVWAFKEPEKKKSVVPEYVKCIRNNSLAFIYHQATAGFWIENYCIPPESIKRSGQTYIQTWHGDRTIKKFLYDMYDDEKALNLYESSNCDLALAASTFGEKIYHSSFHYFGQLLTMGSPRNDVLVNGDDDAVQDFRREYNIPESVNLLLYAPTFRDSNKSNDQKVEQLNLGEVLRHLETKSGKEWRLLSRGHTGRHLLFEGVDLQQVIDASDYEDSRYVLLAADAIISDYSSMATDFVLTGRPTFFYINDLDAYTGNDRALWFDLKSTPFWCAKNQSELLTLIDNYTEETARDNCRAILEFYGSNETGNAAEAVCKYMIDR